VLASLALDRLEELDPTVKREEWFRLLEQTVDGVLKPHLEKAFNPVEH